MEAANWVTAGATVVIAIFAIWAVLANRQLIKASGEQAKASVEQAMASTKLAEATAEQAAMQKPSVEVEIAGGFCSYVIRKQQPAVWQYKTNVPDPYAPPAPPEPIGTQWEVVDRSNDDVVLLVQLDVVVNNRSMLDDGVKSARLVLHRDERLIVNCPAMRDGGNPFFGQSLPAHSPTHLPLEFRYDKRNHGQFPEWSFTPQTTYDLELQTVRGQSITVLVEPFAYASLAAGTVIRIGEAQPANPLRPRREE
jgi:hypothetical protein